MAIVLPYSLVDNTLADAVQVMANFNALAAAVEGVSAAAAGTDVYQAGVVEGTDWTPGAGSVNAGTGVLQFTTFGGAAWLPGPVSGLVRTFTAPSTVGGLKPPVLPGPAGYVCVGVELTASGAQAAVSVVSGAEQVSEAEALAHPPAVSAGKARVRNVIVLNTGGVYSIAKEVDQRAWAFEGAGTLAGEAKPAILAPPSAWSNLTLGAKVQAKGSGGVFGMEPSARLELGASVVRMRGVVMVKSTQLLTAGETLFTLPAGMRPVVPFGSGVYLTAIQSPGLENFLTRLTIDGSGVCTANINIPETRPIGLDGLTFTRS